MTSAVDDLTDCPVCYEPFRDPQKLTCDHTLCKGCLDRMTKKDKIKCPTCSTVSDIKHVKADFRLGKFLDALTKQAEILTEVQPEPVIQDEYICELCTENQMAHFCQNCEQSMCDKCKAAHLRTKYTQDHILEPLSDKGKFHTVLKQHLQSLNDSSAQYQSAVDRLNDVIDEAQNMKNESLEDSKDLRKACVMAVDTLFDSIDERINSFIDERVNVYEGKKEECRAKIDCIEIQKVNLQDALKDEGHKLELEADSIVAQSAEFIDSISATHVQIDKPTVKILRKKTWKAEDAVNLELAPGSVLIQGHQKEPEPSRERRKTWMAVREIVLKPLPEALRVIRQQLWCCHSAGITVYDSDLTKQRNIAFNVLVYDVEELETNRNIVATDRGLYLAGSTGSRLLHKIDSGRFSSVIRYANTVYAAELEENEVRVYENKANAWINQSSFKCPCDRGFAKTIHLKNNRIYVCCTKCGKIYVFSTNWQLQDSYGENGSKDAGQFASPFICRDFTEGLVLIADQNNNRLQTLSASGECNIVDMDVCKPRSAVYFSSYLYVSTRNGTIIKYSR